MLRGTVKTWMRESPLVRVIEYEVPDRGGDGKGELIALITTITRDDSRPGCAARAGLSRAVGA